MTLQDWADDSRLVPHVTSRQEIADLLAVADPDLQGLPTDWRLSIAYNAALQVATAALAAARSPSERRTGWWRWRIMCGGSRRTGCARTGLTF